MTKHYFFIALLLVFFIACKVNTAGGNGNAADRNGNNGEHSQSIEGNNQKKAIANPAATRCVNDGYTLEPVVENGVSVDCLCVNPETGLKCEVWKYFRNECSLKP